jgi:glycosyltransferase involved in cell wall biosynthesis
MINKKADICLVLEGTYPYIRGGVSAWVHELIVTQPHLTFYLLCILPPEASKAQIKVRYELPPNVVGFTEVVLQKLPTGTVIRSKQETEEFFERLETSLLALYRNATLEEFKSHIELIRSANAEVGKLLLFDSERAWKMVQNMYHILMDETSFITFYWSCRILLSGFYSMLLAPMPEASLYHTICTGYAGLYIAMIHLVTGKPCLTTEHGIYTNERHIEIAVTEWLEDLKSLNFTIDEKSLKEDLKDYWINTYAQYAKLCYQASDRIITLFEGNRDLQIKDGADPNKSIVIRNGVDMTLYENIERVSGRPPTVAFIGRIVPVKDVKCFIHSISLLKKKLPEVRAFIIGPSDEDKEYYYECCDLIASSQLEETIIMTGPVKVIDYLSQIDVITLTSLSEAQPLVLLEAGAAGIPCVATNVGCCAEIIYGTPDEEPNLGPAGFLTELATPQSTADHLYYLLADKFFYDRCSKTIKERVRKYYDYGKWREAYKELYDSILPAGERR